MLLIGDSYAEQWQAALAEAGRLAGFRVNTIHHNNCPYTDVEIDRTGFDVCLLRRGESRQAVVELEPDVAGWQGYVDRLVGPNVR